MSNEIKDIGYKEEYESLIKQLREAEADVVNFEERPGEEKAERRQRSAAIITRKIELRAKVYSSVTKVIKSIIAERFGDIAVPGSVFDLEIHENNIRSHLTEKEWEEFSRDPFEGLAALQTNLEDEGIVEGMSGPNPSALNIKFVPEEGQPEFKTIRGRDYKRGRLFD